MLRQVFFACSALLVALLSGCGGSTDSGVLQLDPGIAAFQNAVAADEVQRVAIIGDPDANIRGIPGTVWSSVPTTGQAIFRGTGLAQIGGTGGATDLTLRGDVFMTFNFGTDDINGQMIRLSAVDANSAYDVSGEIDFLNGDIGVVRGNSFTLDYVGDLEIDDAQIALDGEMDGLLRGTRFGVVRRSPIKALSAEDDDGIALVDGNSRPFDLVITAETD